MAVFYEPPERGWTKIPDELIDMDMSFAAIGVLMHMLKNRADWEEPIWRIAQKMHKGKHQVTAAIKELQKHGFARQTERKIGGNLSTKGWDFAWPAFTDENPRSTRDTGFRGAGDRPPDARGLGFRGPGDRSPENRGVLEDSVDEDPANQTLINQDTVNQDTADPAPEDDRPVTMLDFNKIAIPDDKTVPVKRPRTRRNYDYDETFLVAWEAYGRVGGKQQAFQAWKQAIGRAAVETIMAAIPHYLASDLPQRGYTKHFSTWLNDDGWESAESQPKKSGYRGRAGSDVKSLEGEMDRAKVRPICKLMRTGPMPGDLDWNRAWYYHWNVGEQREWTEQQLLDTGNTPEDVHWLMDAYLDGIDPDLYARMKRDLNLAEDA